MKNVFRLSVFTLLIFSSFGLFAQKTRKQQIKEDKVKELKDDDHYLYEGDTLIALDKEHVYYVQNLGEKVNSDHAESGPRISPDGNTLYFFRIGSNKNVGRTRDIWISHYNPKDSSWTEAEHAPAPINNFGDNSVHSVMKDGKALLLHNKYLKNGTTENGLSVSFLGKSGKWSFPEELKIDHYNNDTVCSFHMDNDMKVLILAIRQKKDTRGKQDLYVSFRKNPKDSLHWTKPLNLGTVVNTAKTEATAFLDVDLKTLYFSSDGHAKSLGGFDIYKTTRLDSTWEHWSLPENIGKPFNTPDNEYYYSIPKVGDYVYLAHHFETKDSSSGHSDIVRVRLKPNPEITMVGKIYDSYSKQLITAKITFKRLDDNQIVGGQDVDTVAGYEQVLPSYKKYEYIVESEGYQTKKGKLDFSDIHRSEKKIMDVYLNRNPALELSGLIKDKATGNPIPGTITFKDSKGNIVYTKTLEAGEPYEVVLKGGEKYTYSVNTPLRYLPEVNEIDLTKLDHYKTEKRDMLLNPRNVAFEIKDIFFETAKWDLLPVSYVALDKLVKVLEEVPDLKVEISGHTDDVGKDDYNMNLSQNRAQAVVDYLISKGVNKDNFVAQGYGETKPRATNKTPEGRQENRRVEFKALN